MNMSLLRNCPFCGSEVELYHSEYTDTYNVWCSGCYFKSDSYDEKDELISLWNNRYKETTDTEIIIAALEAKLDILTELLRRNLKIQNVS